MYSGNHCRFVHQDFPYLKQNNTTNKKKLSSTPFDRLVNLFSHPSIFGCISYFPCLAVMKTIAKKIETTVFVFILLELCPWGMFLEWEYSVGR